MHAEWEKRNGGTGQSEASASVVDPVIVPDQSKAMDPVIVAEESEASSLVDEVSC